LANLFTNHAKLVSPISNHSGLLSPAPTAAHIHQRFDRLPEEVRPNIHDYIDVQVFTQSKQDCQWGIFDFTNVSIDSQGRLKQGKRAKDGGDQASAGIHEHCSFRAKGTSYISRVSKYKMGATQP